MFRPLRAEVERYDHYSVAGEFVYDHPCQWGSKRTGPDLARVGGRYSDEWHREHLINPRAVVPESILQAYALLATRTLKPADRKSGGSGKSVSVRVDLGGRRLIRKKINTNH